MKMGGYFKFIGIAEMVVVVIGFFPLLIGLIPVIGLADWPLNFLYVLLLAAYVIFAPATALAFIYLGSLVNERRGY